MIIGFSHPDYLWALFAIPLIIFIFFISLSIWRAKAVKFANFEAISRIKGIDLYSRNFVVLLLSVLLIVLLVFSAAGMNLRAELKTSDVSFVLAIDASKSMEADDFLPSRMDVAKDIAIKFVESNPRGTRVGVVSFSGNSFIEQRVTDEKELIISSIRGINVKGIGGTDIQDSIITSANLLNNEKNKGIILLSDGQINIGGLEEAIDYAKKNEIIIHTIAIGTVEGGLTSYGLSKLDEDSLKAMAYNTGGTFFNANNDEDLDRIFNELIELKLGLVTIDLSKYLAVLAILLFILEFILINTRYKAFP